MPVKEQTKSKSPFTSRAENWEQKSKNLAMRATTFSREIHEAIENHAHWRSECLNLNAAESLLSKGASKALPTDLGRRAVLGIPGDRRSEGGKYIDVIESAIIEMLQLLYNCKYSEWRPMSGSVADAILIHALTNVGDKVVATPTSIGHPTWHEAGYAGFRGLRITPVPFDWENLEVDYDGLRKLVRKERHALCIFGSPLILFPPDFDLLVSSCDAPIWYDGAHIMGLIAGGVFPNPLEFGVLALGGSSQKTLSGPVGGIIMTNDKPTIDKIRTCVSNDTSTPDYGRITALAITLTEWLRNGKKFASAIVENAKSLASDLNDHGAKLLLESKGFTSTHQVGMLAPDGMNAFHAASVLSKANIIVTAFSLPDGMGRTREVLRIGTTEITRQGFSKDDISTIAEFIVRAPKDPQGTAAKVRSLLSARKRRILYS